VLLKYRSTSTKLHDVIAKQTVIFSARKSKNCPSVQYGTAGTTVSCAVRSVEDPAN